MPYEIHLANLPFEIVNACRCSFSVRFKNGTTAFISNANLLEFLRNPRVEYEIITRQDSRGREMPWVAIYRSTLDLGIKPRFFSLGERINR